MLLNHKKEWTLAISDNMDWTRVYFAKYNNSDIFHLYMESKKKKKKQMNKHKTKAELYIQWTNRRLPEEGGGEK